MQSEVARVAEERMTSELPVLEEGDECTEVFSGAMLPPDAFDDRTSPSLPAILSEREGSAPMTLPSPHAEATRQAADPLAMTGRRAASEATREARLDAASLDALVNGEATRQAGSLDVAAMLPEAVPSGPIEGVPSSELEALGDDDQVRSNEGLPVMSGAALSSLREATVQGASLEAPTRELSSADAAMLDAATTQLPAASPSLVAALSADPPTRPVPWVDPLLIPLPPVAPLLGQPVAPAGALPPPRPPTLSAPALPVASPPLPALPAPSSVAPLLNGPSNGLDFDDATQVKLPPMPADEAPILLQRRKSSPPAASPNVPLPANLPTMPGVEKKPAKSLLARLLSLVLG